MLLPPHRSPLLMALFSLFFLSIHSTTAEPLVAPCPNYSSTVACMNKYGSVLPEDYDRSTIPIVGFRHIRIHTSSLRPFIRLRLQRKFPNLRRCSRALRSRALPCRRFHVPNPANRPRSPRLRPDHQPPLLLQAPRNETSQYIIDLSATPPTLSTFTSHPPTIVPAGGTFHAGLVYWCGSATHSGTYIPGLYALNTTTHATTPLLNNYLGLRFTTCDDLAVHLVTSDVWFTDNYYAHNIPLLHRNNTPQLPPAVWRFRPSTGALQLVDDALQQPNGIAFAADGRIAYVSDISADTPLLSLAETVWTQTVRRTVYAFDVDAGFGCVGRRRVLYRAQDRIPDGVKVARNGWVVAAAGHGVDVVGEGGTLVVRVQTNFTVLNLAWAGRDWEDLWLVGVEGAVRVRWGLPGREIV